MNHVFSLLSSRRFWCVVVALVVAILVWVVGPPFSIASRHPLAGIDARFIAIALIAFGVMLWLVGWSTSPALVALLCLAIWYATPLLAYGDMHPFESRACRGAIIAFVVVLFAVYWLYRLWQELRTNRQFLERMLSIGTTSPRGPAHEQVAEMAAITAAALARLKALRARSWLARVFQRARYVYDLPWYLALGASGSGKTGLLSNAGFAFPVVEQMRHASAHAGEPTAHLHWWLANEAVLIDTAGHYTCHGEAGLSVRRAGEPGARATSPAPEREDDVPAAQSGEAETSAGLASTHASAWLALLELVRKKRPRAPINGVVLFVELDVFAEQDETARIAHAAMLRARLAEVRERLGVRVPVYLLVTKMDRLAGFVDYFGSLTLDARAQVWGFTLDASNELAASQPIRARCGDEMGRLERRLLDGLNARLLEEHDPECRRRLVGLPEEFGALTFPIADLVDRVFSDSRYDEPGRSQSLRGVYFTSTRQDDDGESFKAHQHSILTQQSATHRLQPRAPVRSPMRANFFVQHLFEKIILRESHLVRQTLTQGWQSRAMRVATLAGALVVALALANGLQRSFSNNAAYLSAAMSKANALRASLVALHEHPDDATVLDSIDQAWRLPTYPGLDLEAPDLAFRFGLYAAPEVIEHGRSTYDRLADIWLLSRVVQRMEDAIWRAVEVRDATSAYQAMRVYLMLFDDRQFDAAQVKAWVERDWMESLQASGQDVRAGTLEHIDRLFSGRAVRPRVARNETVIARARALLGGTNAQARIYDRLKATVREDAPEDFSVIHELGPQASVLFERASGAPLSQGVPGLFTRDGYRQVFGKRLAGYVQSAARDDAWVMGGPGATARPYGPRAIADGALAEVGGDPASNDIRARYLAEYAERWEAYLGDLRLVRSNGLVQSASLIGTVSGADSPLVRLARAAVRETTLSGTSDDAAKAPLTSRVASDAQAVVRKMIGESSVTKLERERVDDRFAALRDFVGHVADAPQSVPAATPGRAATANVRLDDIERALSAFGNALMQADHAIAGNVLPASDESFARLRTLAAAAPSPFRAPLNDIAHWGASEVEARAAQMLSQVLQTTLGQTCHRLTEGAFPFDIQSGRDIGIDDFTRLVGPHGAFDEYFSTMLSTLVDTSVRPWRYRKSPWGTSSFAGPGLEPFERARALRDALFGELRAGPMTWALEVQVPELDPTVMALDIDIDGQTMRYQHGPVMPMRVSWPGPRGGVHAQVDTYPRIRNDTSRIEASGPWALLRLLKAGRVVDAATPGRTRVAFDFDGRAAVLDVMGRAGTVNLLTTDVFSSFRCPGDMPVVGLPDTGPPARLPSADAVGLSAYLSGRE